MWRKALAAQEKGAVAVLFVSDVHNHPGAANFEATARNYWPEKPPHLLSYTLAAWADRIHIPVAQISPAVAASLVAGTGKTLEELAKASETAHGFAAAAAAGEPRHAVTPPSTATSCRIATSSRCSKAAIRS